MIHTKELPLEKSEYSAEIKFLKKEIEFLLKILKNSYSVSVNKEKLRLLDGYWKIFEKSIQKLDELQEYLNQKQNDSDSVVEVVSLELREINSSTRMIKESFYECMSGCGDCIYKK